MRFGIRLRWSLLLAVVVIACVGAFAVAVYRAARPPTVNGHSAYSFVLIEGSPIALNDGQRRALLSILERKPARNCFRRQRTTLGRFESSSGETYYLVEGALIYRLPSGDYWGWMDPRLTEMTADVYADGGNFGDGLAATMLSRLTPAE